MITMIKRLWALLVFNIVLFITENDAFCGNVGNVRRHLRSQQDSPFLIPGIVAAVLIFLIYIAVTAAKNKKK